MWYERYDKDHHPSLEDMSTYIDNELWDKFCKTIEGSYKVSPVMEYSKCSAQPGWNIKYKKSGKSMCTLYPMEGYFIALVVIGKKEQVETELLMPSCSPEVQELYHRTAFSCGGQWLMIKVSDAAILEDVIKLIEIRMKKR